MKTSQQECIKMSLLAQNGGVMGMLDAGLDMRTIGDNDYGYHDDIMDTFDTENIYESYNETYRGDMISDINKGLNVVSTGIKVISAILTLLGASNNRR